MKILVWLARNLLPGLCSLILVACGGGGGDSGSGSGGGASPTPAVAAPAALSYTSPVAMVVGQNMTVLAPTVTGIVATYAVSPALPAGVGINATTGQISGTPSAATAQKAYTVTASNSAGSATFALALTVNPAAPTALSYPSPRIFVVGQAIAALNPTVTGAVSNYSVAPALPGGLSLNSGSGQLSGTPTAVTAQAVYTVTASNVTGNATFALTIAVNPPAPSALSYSGPQTFLAGLPIPTLSPTVTGVVTSYSVTPALPAGLALNAGNGQITGTPSAVTALAGYTIRAANVTGAGSFALIITINPLPPSGLIYPSPQIYTAGQAIAPLSPAVSGSVTSYSVTPALPAGLSLNTTTGQISGTPSGVVAQASYLITARNVSGTAPFSLSLSVNPAAPTGLSYASPLTLIHGQQIVALNPAVFGVVTSYSVAPALPAGLVLNNLSGQISGTPTAATAQAGYVVSARNVSGAATATIVITVREPSTSQADQEFVASVSLSQTVPSVAVPLISKVTSSSGTQAYIANSAQVVVASGLEPVVLLTDSNDRIVLASFSSTTPVSLDAHSTALALVYLLIDSRVVSASEADLRNLIAAHASFNALVQSVQSVLAAGHVPGTDRPTLGLARTIATDVTTNFVAAASSQAQSNVKVASLLMATIPAQSASNPLPYSALSLAIGAVQITGGLVNVYNSTPIAWSAMTSPYDAAPLSADSTSAVLLDGAGLAGWLASKLPGWLAPNGTTLGHDGTRNFHLRLLQNGKSVRANLFDVAGIVINRIAGISLLNNPGDCTNELVSAIYNDSFNALWVDGVKPATVQPFLSALLSSLGPIAINTALSGQPRLCPGADWQSAGARLLKSATLLGAKVSLWMEAYETATAVADAATVIGKLYWLNANLATDRTILVCTDGSAVQNCADHFEFPDNMVLLEGSTFQPRLNAFDVNGSPTAVPATVRFSVVGAGADIDPLSGEIFAANNADVVLHPTIQVSDPTTGAAGSRTIFINQGMLIASPQRLVLGDGNVGTVRLAATDGGAISSNDVILDWGVSNSQVLNLAPVGAGGTLRLYSAKAVGDALVIAVNGSSGRQLNISIAVDPFLTGGYWIGYYSASTCTPRPGNAYAGIWYAEDPCASSGPIAGSAVGSFYIDDTSSDVIMGSSAPNGDVRRVFPLGWHSTDNSFSYSVPVGYGMGGSVYYSASRQTDFVVTTRTPNSVAGTFTISTTSGYFTTFPTTQPNFLAVPTTASGNWSAQFVVGQRPATQMHGFDFCFPDNTATNQIGLTAGSPGISPSWAGGFVANGCVYGAR